MKETVPTTGLAATPPIRRGKGLFRHEVRGLKSLRDEVEVQQNQNARPIFSTAQLSPPLKTQLTEH
jgi:hypothetical protein